MFVSLTKPWIPATLAAVMICYGCSAGGDAGSASTPASMGAATGPTAVPQTSDKKPAQPALPRKIVYSGDMDLACDNLDVATEKLEADIRAADAYVGNATRSSAAGQLRTAEWTVRVPSNHFDSFLKSLGAVGQIRNSSIKADDVSEEYYDAEARLKNKQIEEGRLIDLLKRDSGRLTDILTVEKEITRVRGEVEEIQGRLRFLTNQTDFSTLTIKLEEIRDLSPAIPTLNNQVGTTFMGSAMALRDFAVGILLVFVFLLPWIVPIGIFAVIVRWIVKLAMKNKPNKTSQP